jgi:hypothetical protein
MSRRGGSPVPDLNSGKEWSKMDLDDLRLFALVSHSGSISVAGQ